VNKLSFVPLVIVIRIHNKLAQSLLLLCGNSTITITNVLKNKCLQCFAAVGWAAGRASGL